MLALILFTIVVLCCWTTYKVEQYTISAIPIKTYTTIASICNNYVTSMDMHGQLVLKSGKDLEHDYFGMDHYSIEQFIHVVTYGTYKFNRETNTIIEQVKHISDSLCKCDSNVPQMCQNIGCDVVGWFGKAGITPVQGITNILLVPEQVGCNFSGRSDIVYKGGINIQGLVHEIGHNVFGLDHASRICSTQLGRATTTCSPSSCCIDVDKGTSLIGDYTCLMGYGPGKFFNVVYAHTQMKCAIPLHVYDSIRDKGVFTHRLMALELTRINCVIITGNDGSNWYISYHKKNDTKFYDGMYDLPPDLADAVYVHKSEKNGKLSCLYGSVCAYDTDRAFADGMFFLSCSRTDGIIADIVIKLV